MSCLTIFLAAFLAIASYIITMKILSKVCNRKPKCKQCDDTGYVYTGEETAGSYPHITTEPCECKKEK